MRALRIVPLLLLMSVPCLADGRFQLQSNFWVSLHQTLLDAGQNNKLVDFPAPGGPAMRRIEPVIERGR